MADLYSQRTVKTGIQSDKDSDQYIPLNPTLLHPLSSCPFPLFVQDAGKEQFVPFSDTNVEINHQHLQILTQQGKKPVYVPVAYSAQLNQMLTDNISSILEDDSLPPDVKTEQFYTLSTSVVKSLFDSPPDIETFIKTAKVVSDGLGDLLMTGHQTIRKLSELRSMDYYTFTHSLNVTAFTVGFYNDLYQNSKPEVIRDLTRGVLLHDIGKCDIPDSILNKKGKLTDEEWEIMKSHTTIGYEKLDSDEELSEDSRLVSLCHHEAFDGSGYPERIKGDTIPLTSRICKVCDVYDALTSKRAYKNEIKPFEALQMMKTKMVSHFDKDLLIQFIHFLRKVYQLGE